MATDHRVTLVPVATGFMDKGADFGSPDVKIMHAPRVAMATGEGTSSLGAGEVWHYLERDLQYPVTLINAANLNSIAWHKYDVVILPEGYNYKPLFDKDGAMKKWIQQGGKLIVMENAVSQLVQADWGLSNKKEADEKDGLYDNVRRYENQEKESLQYNNPGSIFKVEVDNSHPLGYGFDKTYFTLKADNNVYEFMENGWNVGVIKKEAQIAGFTGNKAKAQLKDGVLFGEVPVGRGSVVFFADDVLFRNFWESGKLLMANALFMVNSGNAAR
ncbi:hypothetical protein [Phnomibacter ginsenosidimutans]|uniref:hypothetical protein n=1 Tax=Phnomibacter ginsenosidimutans TaxID=2676868 RepID=UPI0018D22130|nr:hypothetical protein [Phnomibacter ginsenosidimutans]